MSDRLDLSHPKHVEEVMNILFCLPENDSDSEAECDFGASGDLNSLDESLQATSVQSCIPCDNADDECVEDLDVGASFQAATDDTVTQDDSDQQSDEEWGDDCSQLISDSDRCHSIQSAVSKHVFRSSDNELCYFLKLFDDDIFNIIVNETNRYATQNRALYGGNVGTTKGWNDTNIREIKAFIGCLIIMGIHELPALSNFWSSDPVLRVDAVAEVMSSKRFKKLVENIHCNNNEDQKPRSHPDYDKLHKLRPLLTKILENCKANYDHSSFLSVDESMIAFKGRSSMKQYMPMKPVKRGYKVWCLCDAETGYVLNFDIYTGKSKDNTDGYTLGERVVLKLTECVQQKGALVAFDNFFTSPRLMSTLLKKGIYSCGTVRVNRRGLPPMMKDKSKLSRGEFQFQTKGAISAVKWMDNRAVTLLSTFHDPRETTTVTRKNKDGTQSQVFCPVVVANYNTIMGGVD